MDLTQQGAHEPWREPGSLASAAQFATPAAQDPAPALREALQHALRSLEGLEAQGSASLWQAWLRVGCCYRQLHALPEAHSSLRQALRCARLARRGEALSAVLCELAENTCDLAEALPETSRDALRQARDKARDEAFEASKLLLQDEGSTHAANRLQRLAQVLARCGDLDDAAAMQCRARLWAAGGTEH